MNWHKTNLALIAILLVIDIFLGIMLRNEYRSAKLLPDDMISEASENLKEKGIVFDEHVIDKELYKKRVYSYTSHILFAEEMRQNAEKTHPYLVAALAHLSGQSIQGINQSLQYFDIPGSTSVSVLKKDETVFATASVIGESEFEFSKPEIDSELMRNKSVSVCEKLSFGMKEIACHNSVTSFINYVYNGVLGIKPIYSEAFDGGTLYVCAYTSEGIEIDGLSICIYVKNGSIEYIYGDFFFSKLSSEYDAKLVDGINILYSLVESEKTADIISEKLAYAVIDVNNGQQYLVPVWIIEYENGNGEQISLTFNALTGEKIR